jgi:hypothetical protein
MSDKKDDIIIFYSSPLPAKTCAWLLVSKLTARVTSFALIKRLFFTYKGIFLIEPCWFFIRGGKWRKMFINVSYIRTLGAPGIRPDARHVLEARPRSGSLKNWCGQLPHQHPNAGLLVPMQDWSFLRRSLVSHRWTRLDPRLGNNPLRRSPPRSPHMCSSF